MDFKFGDLVGNGKNWHRDGSMRAKKLILKNSNGTDGRRGRLRSIICDEIAGLYSNYHNDFHRMLLVEYWACSSSVRQFDNKPFSCLCTSEGAQKPFLILSVCLNR